MIKQHKIMKKVLFYIYKFDAWHLESVKEKKYVIDIVDYIQNNNEIKNVTEIGCGLGDIVGNIKNKKCYGYDVSDNAIKAAKKIWPHVKFSKGTWENIYNKHIDCLVTVNFIHVINPEILKRDYQKLLEDCDVKYVILDSVASRKYRYKHNESEILGDNYKKLKVIGTYKVNLGIRKVIVYQKVKI